MAKLVEIHESQWVGINEFWTLGDTLYLIEEVETGHTKIGIATNPFRRFSSLQCGNHRKLELRRVFGGHRDLCKEAEKRALIWLRHKKLRGEWVALSPAEVVEALIFLGHL